MQTQRVRSYDDTELVCHVGGRADGVPLVLCNGLGAGWPIWQPLVARFEREFRIFSWEYRGTYGSDPALERGDYSIDHHVRDLVFLLDHFEIESPVVFGWSMGVQLALELHRNHPTRARGLVMVHGAPGRPFRTAFDTQLSERVAPAALGLLRLVGRGFNGVGSQLARFRSVTDGFVAAGRTLGVMAPSLDRDRFQEICKHWVMLDLAAYADNFESLQAHDASDLLDRVEAPVLLVSGGRDLFTPAHLAEGMARALPDAEILHLPEATHFGLLEYPDEIVDGVEKYLRHRLGIERQPKAS